MEPRIASMLLSQISYLPFLLVYVAGILIAIFRWSHHPKVSLAALAAFGLLLVALVVRMGAMIWLLAGRESGMGFAAGQAVFSWISFGTVVLDLVAWVLLMMALYGWRRGSAADPLVDGPGQG